MMNLIMLETIVFECMEKFAKENCGEQGWTKEDIQNAVLKRGGKMEDVYEAMKIGLKICIEEDEGYKHFIS